ncbi:unnamed protein product [Pleuronectes platessa]|uniref:Uncharacterized protein n=1 Tax=Pleuronectes platessa TaxID=8262 RepID=A0A9N7ZCQ9_PLEPL|nr:unnamed protein product [Pleuronectes platessa]
MRAAPRIARLYLLFPRDLTQLAPDHQDAPAAPVSADSVPYQQSLHPETTASSYRRTLLRSTRPGITTVLAEMAKTAIGGFAGFEDAEAVATPMAQKDAEGW